MTLWEKTPLLLKILVPGLVAIFLVATGKPKPAPQPHTPADVILPKVQVVPAVPTTARLSVQSQGTVNPKVQIELVAEVAGRVIGVSEHFVNGGRFQRDDLLLEIDPRDYETAVLAAKARLAQARQALAEERGRAEQAKREWRDLGNNDANDLFLRKPHLAFAEAELQAAGASLEKAQLDLARTRITLPFTGRVRMTNVNVGQYVSRGTPLATVYDTAALEVRLSISDRQASLMALPPDYQAEAGEAAPQVTLTGVIGGAQQQWQGYIARTEASIDTRSRFYYAVAEIDTAALAAAGHEVPPVGLFVEAAIEGKALDQVMRLPEGAVFMRDKIYVLDSDQQVALETVQVLQQNDRQVWIKSAIATGTPILVEKQPYVSVGGSIDPIPYQESVVDDKQRVAVSARRVDVNTARGPGIKR